MQERTRRVATMGWPQDAMQVWHQINRRLYEDNAIGLITEQSGREIIKFSGRETPQEEKLGPFEQGSEIDGIVIRLGGQKEWVPVFLESSHTIYTHCSATRALAKELGRFIFGPE